MERFNNAVIESLSNQLLRGPKRLRLHQLLNIEFLLSVVENSKSYPFEFVRHALTGFRGAGRDGSDSPLLDGEALAADLVQLADVLSTDADIPVEAWPEPLFAAADLAARFDVSTKTIMRWRRRGLASWKFRFPDRRMRVLFTERCVRRFVGHNLDLVHRGSSFSQLSDDERTAIITRAHALAAEGHRTINSSAKVISVETNRAVETIRLILKHYDAAHPQAGIFNRPALQVAVDDQRFRVWEAYVDGATVEALAERTGRPIAWVYRAITQMRACELKARKLEFIYSPEFDAPGAEKTLLAGLDKVATEHSTPVRIPAGLPPYLEQLFRIPLLSADAEVRLFRAMNYLKYRADQLREELDSETARASELDRIENLLADAGRVKNRIVQANLRLVVSIAKRHANPAIDFFEIVSDGNLSLMRAVDKFDYTRGFKFSTYGSWAIMKNFARSMPEQRLHRDRYQTGREELLESAPGAVREEQESDHLVAVRGTLERMLATLDERERSILRQRFGLDDGGEPQTLEQIGKRFGISKERIRQLESRAMARLRTDFEQEARQLLGV